MTSRDGIDHPRETRRQGAPVGLGKRLKRMTGVWCVFGILVGLAALPPQPNAIGVVAGVLAGLIVLVPLGVVLGLVGGQPGPTLFGGGAGASLGVVAGILAVPSGVTQVGAVALVGGATAGATVHLAASWALYLHRSVTLTERPR
jgi:di/tricarboxylate transporter